MANAFQNFVLGAFQNRFKERKIYFSARFQGMAIDHDMAEQVSPFRGTEPLRLFLGSAQTE